MTDHKPDKKRAAEAAEPTPGIDSFKQTLEKHGLELRRDQTHTLQVNIGLLCNQACKHCHLNAGPRRKEVMSRSTMNDVIAYARRVGFEVIDITGGAPEMVPDIGYLISELAPLTPRLMLRSNLTALAIEGREQLLEICIRNRVVIVSSFPATNQGQTDSQRGEGVWEESLRMLKRLNEVGYGVEGSGLELDLVANPSGAFLPTSQQEAERKFKRDLERKFGIAFNHLYTFANMPLGRFRSWLEKSGNYPQYMEKLAQSFNPCTIAELMCRTLVSVSWDGYLYDCDFNQAEDLPLGGKKIHVAMMEGLPEPGTLIAAGDHCYACTAGSGFT